jgi:hypothetical protein
LQKSGLQSKMGKVSTIWSLQMTNMQNRLSSGKQN